MNVRRKFSISFIFAAAFLAGILFSTAGANWVGAGSLIGLSSTAESSSSSIEQFDGPTASSIDEAFVNVADLVNPSVVQIHSEVVAERQTNNPFEGFFNFPNQPGQNVPNQPTEFRSTALGSGVFVASDGIIVTNYHVIKDAEELEVMTFDGSYYEAEVVGTDPNSDLAVIRIKKSDATPIQFASPSDIRVGQWVMAFGSPLAEELGNTVTSGIVSATRRNSSTLASLNMFSAFIQTDAAINPGNSGGPLVNLKGQLIGLNSAILSRSGGSQGIGFAIPVDVVKNVTNQLIETGSVERGFLGVNFDRVSSTLAKALKVPRAAAQITSISEGAPAEKAGLKEGDIIVAINGIALNDFNELRTTIANLPPGEKIELEIAREEGRKIVPVLLGKRSSFVADESGAPEAATPFEKDAMATLGLEIESVTAANLERLGVKSEEKVAGVFVSKVNPNSLAYREGDLRQGDIITEINRKSVATKADFLSAFEKIKANETFLIRAYRASKNPDGTTDLKSFLTALSKPE